VRFLGGGNLRCWKKSSCLSDAGASSGFFSAVLADFRRLRSQPPTKPQTGQYPEPRRPFRHKDMLKEDSPTKKEKRPREFDTLKSKKVLQSLEIGLFFCQIFIFII